MMGFGKNFYSMNREIVKLFVNVPWCNGKNFSERIWENTDKLSNYLSTDIAQGFARGDSYDMLVRQLMQRFEKVSRNDAYRLIYTEGTYVMAESTMRQFTEDFEEYGISTVGDGKVCSICRDIAEKTFNIKDRQPGVNFLLFHSYCRCTFLIRVSDWNQWMAQYEKKHQNGQAEKVMERLSGITGSDMIKSSGVKEDKIMSEIKMLGKINLTFLEKEFGKIQTDGIIVTNERLSHIQERHPQDYKLFEKYGRDSVQDPDYIVKDEKNAGTVFMIKRLPDTNLNVVVRVALNTDKEGLKNSVMTFYRIRERNLSKIIKKNKLLYKKE